MERCGHSSGVFRDAACEGRARADFRTRAAGLRRAKLRPAAASLKPQIQHSKFKIQNYKGLPSTLGLTSGSGRSLRRTHVRVRTAGLRRPKLRPAGRCATDSAQKKQRPRNDDTYRKASSLQLPIVGEESPANSIPEGSAARSRPRAEGCSSTSQARPLGCGLLSNGSMQ